jgi:hypothetical protein
MDSGEIISYILVFLGIAIFYPAYNVNNNFGIFFGSSIFLIGIVFFINTYFEIQNSFDLLLPSAIMILSISFLLIYISELTDKKFIILSIITGVIGLFIIFNAGNPTLNLFVLSIKNILNKLWIIILLVIATIFLVITEHKKKD